MANTKASSKKVKNLTTTNAKINTDLINVSVTTNASEPSKAASIANIKEDSEEKKYLLNARKRYYWEYLGNELLSYSTILFITSLIFIRILYTSNSSDLISAGVILFSIIALISSVVVKMKQNSSKWIKFTMLKTIVQCLSDKEISEKDFKELIAILGL